MKRSFIHVSKAWYGKSTLDHKEHFDEILVMVEKNDRLFEFSIEFHNILGSSARIACFDDATSALVECSDLIKEMSHSRGWTPNSFAKLLIRQNFEDVTPEKKADKLSIFQDECRKAIRKNLEIIYKKINWEQIPGDLVTLGLFVKGDQFFVASLGVGCPDTVSDSMFIGSKIFGISSMSYSDGDSDFGETADILLVNSRDFIKELTGNNNDHATN